MRTISLFVGLFLFFIACKTSEKSIKVEDTQAQAEVNIPYEKFTLSNGLEVILHEDHSDPVVAVATLIHVGSNREKPGKTGFAHFFEHMAFNDSENVPRGANRKLIPEWGGTRNGGTWGDGTIYYEVVPKDAFDKILWIDSDRLGYIIKTVTDEALEREKQVVKNEKRQNYDNRAYGYTNEVVRANLYPSEHPYNWTTIGQLPDLQAATLEDVTEFYNQYYGASNATIAIVGDIDIEETKKKVEQWFGEIRRGPEVKSLDPQPVSLNENKLLYFEDDFATLPELRMTFPTVEEYHEDSYALQTLGVLLSRSRKSPMNKHIVDEKKLAPSVSTYQSGSELAGTFTIRVRANKGIDLDEVKKAIEESFVAFETNGISASDMQAIKASQEKSLYTGIETVLDKAFQLVSYNVYTGDPAYMKVEAKKMLAVSPEDVMRVYEKYIKNKNYIMTSFVPKGELDNMVEGSSKAEVWKEEVKDDVANEEVSQGEEAVFEKTVTKFDRSEPDFGKAPLFKMPEIWNDKLSNGMGVYGSPNHEIPVVYFDLTIDGGHLLDPIDKPGVADLLAGLLMEGTQNKTSIELEEAIKSLGAYIGVKNENEEIIIEGNCLTKNFEKTMALVEEILLEPRWDEKELERLISEQKTTLVGREARPTSVAFLNMNKLLYGENHVFSTSRFGDLNVIENIEMNDLKTLYGKCSPKNANFHIVGAIGEERVIPCLSSLSRKWVANSDVEIPSYSIPSENEHAGKLYFIDIPDSKQSTIFLGQLTLPATSPDFKKIQYANEILGGGISARLSQTLRIEKGYTYGAYSFIRNANQTMPFIAYTSVRANATLPSLEVLKDLVGNYAPTFLEEDAEITKNKVIKRNTTAYESLSAKLSLLRDISKYGKSKQYIEEEQNMLMNMSVDDFRTVINTYMSEENMVYLIVGDAKTQLEKVNQFGKGEAILIDVYGNTVEK